MRKRLDPVVGARDFERVGDKTMATVVHASGLEERREVRVSVEAQITRSDGTVEPKREVASTDDGSVRLAA